MSWIDQSSYENLVSNFPTNERLSSFGTVPRKQEVTSGSVTYLKIRETVQGGWKWNGMDEDTARMMVKQFSALEQYLAVYPNVGSHLYLAEAAVAAGNTLKVRNLRPDRNGEKKVYAGSKLCVWPDDTVYTVTADANVPTQAQELGELIINPSLTLRDLALDKTNDKIYYTTIENTLPGDLFLRRCDLDGSNDTSIHSYAKDGIQGATSGICLHVGNSHIYYSTGYHVRRVGFNGTGDTQITDHGNDHVMSLSCDETNSYLYIATSGGLYRTDLSGGSSETISSGYIYAVTANPSTGGCYYSTSNHVFVRYDSTSDPVNLNIGSFPHGLVWDDGSSKLYLANFCGAEHDVARTGPDGERKITLISSGSYSQHEMDVYVEQNSIYYCSGNIYRADIMTEPVTLSVTPDITAATAALGADAEVYFFFTDSCRATRATAANFTVELQASFNTRWLRGPNIEQES